MWYLLVSYIALIYLLTNTVTPRIFGGVAEAYVVRPLLWVSIAILALTIAKREGIEIWYFRRIRRWQFGRSPIEGAILIGSFQVSLLIIAGLFQGFGRSPHSFTPLSILSNAFLVFSFIFGMELTRAYLTKKIHRKNVTLSLIAIAVFLMIARISFNRYLSINPGNPVSVIRFLGETIVPSLAIGFFATYLAYLGGALTSIGYMATIISFEWFCPILPDLDWIILSLIKTVAPAIGYMVIQSSIEYVLPRKLHREPNDSTLGWIGAALVSLMLVFFSFGYFGVQPIVICSGSMRPTIDVGDIVIVMKAPVNTIKKGDIIQFSFSNSSVVHRVYDIKKERGNIVFITKGDANNKPDVDPVKPGQVMGKVIFIIPKVGWLSIFIKEGLRKILTGGEK